MMLLYSADKKYVSFGYKIKFYKAFGHLTSASLIMVRNHSKNTVSYPVL